MTPHAYRTEIGPMVSVDRDALILPVSDEGGVKLNDVAVEISDSNYNTPQ